MKRSTKKLIARFKSQDTHHPNITKGAGAEAAKFRKSSAQVRKHHKGAMGSKAYRKSLKS